MKNRSRAFHCAIAGKIVGIGLRHGGGLQEPDRVYVRCDERDCQYADLNELPCPLRIDMFADGSDHIVAAHLVEHAGQRFCYACLTETLGVTHEQVRRASWRLKEDAGCMIGPARCSGCRCRRVTIWFTATGVKPAAFVAARRSTVPAPVIGAPPLLDDVTSRIEAHLRRQAGYGFCPHCLARELGAKPSDVRERMWALEARPEFEVRTTQCVSCLLTKPVIAFQERPSDQHGPRRVIEVLVRAAAGAPLCAPCVAFAADMALADVRRALKEVRGLQEFATGDRECATCGRWQDTVAFVGDVPATQNHIAEIAETVHGRVRYRGLRIDLLSFRTAGGWRPFALVRSPVGALTADAPPIVLDVAPTKAEADEVAAVRAREWIDKRSP